MPSPLTSETPEQIKARGAFYTPPAVADFISTWAIRSRSDRVLEPSCGDGAFIAAARRRFEALGATGLAKHLIGVELNAEEATKAAAQAPDATIHTASFFDLSPEVVGGRMDAAIGNPPYIRYHGWTGKQRTSSTARALEQGVELSSLSSSWAGFLVHAASFLADDGRLALVLPAELLHTNYAQAVRSFLIRRFSSVVIIAFDRLIFEDAQVDAVLLMASNDDEAGLRVIRLQDDTGLSALSVVAATSLGLSASDQRNDLGSGRWSAHVSDAVVQLYSELVASGSHQRLGAVASCDIGFVSGSNAYFVLSAKEADERGLPDRALLQAVERPADLGGLTVVPTELRRLFRPDEVQGDGEGAIRAYLAEGEKRGIPDRYKPSHRKPWYRVPLPRQRADLFLPYMSHHPPRLVLNEVGAVSSNLVHGVTLTADGIDGRALAAASLGSVWALSAEIEGRAYGGGVLKLETKEAEQLLMPIINQGQQLALLGMFERLDQLIRAGEREQAGREVDEVLGTNRQPVLAAATLLRDRRQRRKGGR